MSRNVVQLESRTMELERRVTDMEKAREIYFVELRELRDEVCSIRNELGKGLCVRDPFGRNFSGQFMSKIFPHV